MDGNLYKFGESANGRLGLKVEQLANRRIPQRVQGILGSLTQVSCGGGKLADKVLVQKRDITIGRY